MPRPGPRPYECVRRAWHSDRHQPIRGSLIQEIFRVANEVHSSATKKNKEWQEKLPTVVLKAEEIMYSKANSEAEYMDLKTLWGRVNDAIDTIIRRDESTESGNLLQPCIEAALHLGCTPRRTSRSQRNVNLRCYLSSTTQEPNTVMSCMLESNTMGYNTTKLSNMSCCPDIMKHTMKISVPSAFETRDPLAAPNGGCAPSNFSFPSATKTNPCFTCPPSKGCSSFPLYYGNCLISDKPGIVPVLPSSSNRNNMDPAVGVNAQVHSSAKADASSREALPDSMKIHEVECDLSLRLGPLSAPCSSNGINHVQHVPNDAADRSKLNDLSMQGNEFPLFPRGKASDPLGSSMVYWKSETKHMNAEATMRKRKADRIHQSEDQRFCWQAKLRRNH